MARLLKNEVLQTGSSAIRIPSGATADRPSTPINGQMRFNTDTSRFEIYYNAWKEVAISGTVTITKDSFTGDASTTTFTLTKTPTSTQTIMVFVGNVHQNPDDAFTLAGNQITFYNAPPSGQTIVVFHNFASTDAN
jgi:stress response protein SCP2